MAELAIRSCGKKFMWDKAYYSTESEAKEKMKDYEKKGFETSLLKNEDKFLVYSRKLITNFVPAEGGGI